jgi:hypothetical protein
MALMPRLNRMPMDGHEAGTGCVGAAKAAKGVAGHCVAVRPFPAYRASRRSHRAGIAWAKVHSSKQRGGPHPDRLRNSVVGQAPRLRRHVRVLLTSETREDPS